MLMTEDSESTSKQTTIKNINSPTHEPTMIFIFEKFC
jgi:hypothetical protein